MPLNTPPSTTISISTGTILKVILFVLLLGFLYLVRDVLAVLFVSLVFAAALNPSIDALQRKKIPRTVGALLVFILILGLFSLSLILLIPPIVEQVGLLAENFPQYYDRILKEFQNLRDFSTQHGLTQNIERSFETIQGGLSQATGGVFSALTGFFGGVFAFIAIVVIAFYVLIEENGLKKIFHAFAPTKYRPFLTQLINRIEMRMGLWLRGQLFLLLIVGGLSFIAVWATIGLKYALVLALWAGLTEFVPLVGPIVGAIPAVFIAFALSPLQGAIMIAAYVLIQQLENHVIVPRVMSVVVGLSPVLVIIVMLVGAKVAGVPGIILAVPFTLIVSEVFRAIFGLGEEAEAKA